MGISDNDLLNLSTTRNQKTELASALLTELAEAPCCLGVDEGVLGNASSVETLDPLGLIGFQSLSVSMQFGRNGAISLLRLFGRRGDSATAGKALQQGGYVDIHAGFEFLDESHGVGNAAV